jgi:outer membrane protein
VGAGGGDDNLAVVAGQAAVEMARLETRKAQAARYPQLDLTASVRQSRSRRRSTRWGWTWRSGAWAAGVVPIYSGGGLVARERETRDLLEQATAELDGARRNGMLNARQAFLNANAGLAQVQCAGAGAVSAQTALQSNQRGLELGVRANIDVLNAQQQVSTTELDLSRSRYDTLLALLRLKAAAGRLGENDLRELNALFAP